jgi:hypothetical protein
MRPAALLVLLAACGTETFDPAPIGSIVGYTQPPWVNALDVSDSVPGHGDTYRKIYVNDVGQSYTGGRYTEGTIVVKEIRNKVFMDGVALPGDDIEYISVMRKVGRDGTAPVPIEGGWVFSYLESGQQPGDDETYWDLCWAQCHRQGPWDGAWYDYGN